MKREAPSSRRGLVIISILGITILLAGGAVLALTRGESRGLQSMSPRERLDLARSAYASQEFRRAEELLAPLAQAGSLEIPDRLFYGRVLLALGRLSKARDVFNAIHKEAPNTEEAVLALGELHERAGERDLAISCYNRASDMKKDDPRAFRLLGLAQYSSGDRMAAMFSIRQSLRLLPGQEDLSKLLNELGTGRQARLASPDPRSRAPSFDPFDNAPPRAGSEWDLMPRPEIPDPLRGLPRPDGRIR